MAIGQGYLLATPLHVNTWTNIIANGGNLCKPTIRVVDGHAHTAACRDLGLSERTIQTITNGMVSACSQGGTAWHFFDFRVSRDDEQSFEPSLGIPAKAKVPVACKTGTAELSENSEKTHAWFTVFAPVSGDLLDGLNTDVITGKPEISVTVLVEEGGEGSEVSAPIAKAILEAYFHKMRN